jgi:hypothetical protein
MHREEKEDTKSIIHVCLSTIHGLSTFEDVFMRFSDPTYGTDSLLFNVSSRLMHSSSFVVGEDEFPLRTVELHNVDKIILGPVQGPGQVYTKNTPVVFDTPESFVNPAESFREAMTQCLVLGFFNGMTHFMVLPYSFVKENALDLGNYITWLYVASQQPHVASLRVHGIENRCDVPLLFNKVHRVVFITPDSDGSSSRCPEINLSTSNHVHFGRAHAAAEITVLSAALSELVIRCPHEDIRAFTALLVREEENDVSFIQRPEKVEALVEADHARRPLDAVEETKSVAMLPTPYTKIMDFVSHRRTSFDPTHVFDFLCASLDPQQKCSVVVCVVGGVLEGIVVPDSHLFNCHPAIAPGIVPRLWDGVERERYQHWKRLLLMYNRFCKGLQPVVFERVRRLFVVPPIFGELRAELRRDLFGPHIVDQDFDGQFRLPERKRSRVLTFTIPEGTFFGDDSRLPADFGEMTFKFYSNELLNSMAHDPAFVDIASDAKEPDAINLVCDEDLEEDDESVPVIAPLALKRPAASTSSYSGDECRCASSSCDDEFTCTCSRATKRAKK